MCGVGGGGGDLEQQHPPKIEIGSTYTFTLVT